MSEYDAVVAAMEQYYERFPPCTHNRSFEEAIEAAKEAIEAAGVVE